MFGKVDIDYENCLMFEWVKNVLQSDKVSLINVPRNHSQFGIFIDGFYDESKKKDLGKNFPLNFFCLLNLNYLIIRLFY